MGLRVKFNLILLVVFAAGFLTVGLGAYRYLQKQTRDEATRAASIALDAAGFSAINPLIASALGSRVSEMKMQEFVATDARSAIERDVVTRLQLSKTGETAGEASEGNTLTFFMARS